MEKIIKLTEVDIDCEIAGEITIATSTIQYIEETNKDGYGKSIVHLENNCINVNESLIGLVGSYPTNYQNNCINVNESLEEIEKLIGNSKLSLLTQVYDDYTKEDKDSIKNKVIVINTSIKQIDQLENRTKVIFQRDRYISVKESQEEITNPQNNKTSFIDKIKSLF